MPILELRRYHLLVEQILGYCHRYEQSQRTTFAPVWPKPSSLNYPLQWAHPEGRKLVDFRKPQPQVALAALSFWIDPRSVVV